MRKVYFIIAALLFSGLVATMPLYEPPQSSPAPEIGESYRERLRDGEYEELVKQFGARHARQIDSLRFPQRYQP